MPVNIKLFNVGICGGMGGHGTVSGFVGVVIIIKVHGFCIGLELFDDAVGIFRIVFRNPCFYAGGIKDGHTSFGGVDGMADGFGKVNKPVEERPDITKEGLLETGDLRSIRNPAEAAEFPEMA